MRTYLSAAFFKIIVHLSRFDLFHTWAMFDNKTKNNKNFTQEPFTEQQANNQ